MKAICCGAGVRNWAHSVGASMSAMAPISEDERTQVEDVAIDPKLT
jgi:hypothetical protein